MRRPLTALVACVFAFSVLATGWLVPPSPASAANTIGPTTTIDATTLCGNGSDNTPGLGLICEVTVINTITATGGSSIVTVRECHGAAGDPEAACWTPPSTALGEPVTAITLCNNSMWGGGSTLRCSVHITNNFSGVSSGSPVVVTQCNDSSWGGGSTVDCTSGDHEHLHRRNSWRRGRRSTSATTRPGAAAVLSTAPCRSRTISPGSPREDRSPSPSAMTRRWAAAASSAAARRSRMTPQMWVPEFRSRLPNATIRRTASPRGASR